MRYFKVLVLLTLFSFILLFFAQNIETLSGSLFLSFTLFGGTWFSFEYPFYFMALAVFILGGIFCLLYFFMDKIRLSSRLKECKNRVSTLEQEVNSLRNLPLEENPPSGVENEND